MAKLSIIIPCFQNEHNIPETGGALLATEARFPPRTDLEYILVDDGSTDRTWQQLLAFRKKRPRNTILIKLAKNVGSNLASLSGITRATGDCLAILAADLQDPPEFLPGMLSRWQKGARLVIAYRAGRNDSPVSDFFSNFFHALVRFLAFPQAPKGGFDLVLFDRSIAKRIKKLQPRHFFLPYLLLSLEKTYVGIPYRRRKRAVGVSQWTLAKKIRSGLDILILYAPVPFLLSASIIFIAGLLLTTSELSVPSFALGILLLLSAAWLVWNFSVRIARR